MRKIQAADFYLFDLDNTLYPPNAGVLEQIIARMQAFVADKLQLDPVEAEALSESYYRQYGGTLKGIELHHQHIDIGEFIHYSHDIDYSCVVPCERLKTALTRLDGNKILYTNSPRHYARQMLERLELDQQFGHIFSVEDADYHLKPDPVSFQRICKHHGFAPHQAAFFDDQLSNLATAKEMGMLTIWRTGAPQHADNHHREHYITDDLPVFINQVVDSQ